MHDKTGSESKSGAKEPALSESAAAELRDCGLTSTCSKVIKGNELEPEEISALIRAPLPALCRVVSLAQPYKTSAADFRPVFLIPLAELIETQGAEAARAAARESLLRLDGSLVLGRTLFVAVDRWEGSFALSDLLSALRFVLDTPQTINEISFVGPSAVEIQDLAGHHKGKASDPVEAVLKQLLDFHLNRLDGGTAVEVHAAAAALGFYVSVGQDVSQLFQAEGLYNRIDPEVTYMLRDRFAGDLISLQLQIKPADRLLAWFPWSRSALEAPNFEMDQPFAAPLARVIALARLLLPNSTFVRAPLSLFGKHLSQVMLDLGADDLGFVAVDSVTAKRLGMTKMSEICDPADEEKRFRIVSV